jgi:hypothetical protein
VNNTDINTRVERYSNSSRDGRVSATNDEDGGCPASCCSSRIIQGADCCAILLLSGLMDGARIGERVIVRNAIHRHGRRALYDRHLQSEYNGGLPNIPKTFAAEAYAVDDTLSDAEWAVIPCAFSTAKTCCSGHQ